MELTIVTRGRFSNEENAHMMTRFMGADGVKVQVAPHVQEIKFTGQSEKAVIGLTKIWMTIMDKVNSLHRVEEPIYKYKLSQANNGLCLEAKRG